MVSWLVVLPLGVLALHYRSLPFAWHVRMLVTEVRARWRTTSRFKLIGANRGQRVQASSPHLLLDALPIGRDVFTDVVVEDFRVGFDDGDFLGHLSNSCYAKNLDYARMSYASSRLPLFFRDNGWIALGAIQFKYLHEIPIGAKYQIRMATLGWDDKWFYVRSIFYSPSKSKKGDGNEVIHCESVSRHCFKYKRRTMPPWLVFATAGYAPAGSATPRANWEKTEAVRLSLAAERKGRGDGGEVNLLAAWAKDAGTENEKEWMRKEHWDVQGWEEQRIVDPALVSL